MTVGGSAPGTDRDGMGADGAGPGGTGPGGTGPGGAGPGGEGAAPGEGQLATLVARLRGAGLDPDVEQLCDALWLARWTRGPRGPSGRASS
ncbi:hypothetical protein EAO72_15260, partial [Streptomyces sp. or43]